VYFMLYDVEGTLLFESLHNGDTPDPIVSPGHYVSRATIPADFLASRPYEIRIDGGIHGVRHAVPQPTPIKIALHVIGGGRVNRGYPGYVTPGRLSPLIPWRTEVIRGRTPPA